MDYRQLSENQKRVLDVIISNIKTQGLSPTIREIKDRTKINSLRGVTLQLDALEKYGLITRKKGARGIIVTSSLLQVKEETINIPLMTCSLPAGPASDADGHYDEHIDVSLLQTKGLKDVFAVRISGDSMIGENINEGNIAIIFPQQVANDGDIVAAKTEEGVTLKKYRVVEGRSILFPANPKYQPITQKFEIQGKLINIIKNKKAKKS